MGEPHPDPWFTRLNRAISTTEQPAEEDRAMAAESRAAALGGYDDMLHVVH